jgi:hypothetical protein
VREVKDCQDLNGTSLHGEPHKESESKGAQISQFLPTSRRIVQFSNGKVYLVGFSFFIMQRLSSITTFCSAEKKEKKEARIMF